jgi:hypothetical protein
MAKLTPRLEQEHFQMAGIALLGPKDPFDFPDWRFETLDIVHDAETASIWMNYQKECTSSGRKLQEDEKRDRRGKV